MSDLLSIITPCYQAEAFITACLENVIQQKCSEVEHIILDGGSTDGTLAILEDYAKRYPHIRFISEKDKGQSDAMNKGIHMAKGNYIGFLNADDGYFPFTLNRIISLIKRQEKPVVLVGNCILVNQQNQVIYRNRPARLQAYHLYSGVEPYPINPSAYFYAKEIHADPRVGFYDLQNHYNMDYAFFLSVCLHFPLIYHAEDWGFMLQHPEAKTTKDQEAKELESRKKELLNKTWDRLPIKVKLLCYLYKFKKHFFS